MKFINRTLCKYVYELNGTGSIDKHIQPLSCTGFLKKETSLFGCCHILGYSAV
jgi:hypothetical protein